MWTTLRCISIGPSPTIDIFSMDYPPIIIIIRLPSEPFSLDSSHALTPIVLGFQCIWNACIQIPIQSNHMQICKHAHIHIISNHTIMSCNYHFKHQNYLTWASNQTRAIQLESLYQTHFHTKIYFRITIPRNSKTLGFTVPTLNNSSVHFVNPHFTASLDLFQIKAYINT